MIYLMVPFPVTLSDPWPRFKVMVIRPIDALDVLCAQLTRDLFAIAKFLYYISVVVPAYLVHTIFEVFL